MLSDVSLGTPNRSIFLRNDTPRSHRDFSHQSTCHQPICRQSIQRQFAWCQWTDWSQIARYLVGLVLLSLTLLTQSACGGGAQADEPEELFQIRAPHPTFTPTAEIPNQDGETDSTLSQIESTTGAIETESGDASGDVSVIGSDANNSNASTTANASNSANTTASAPLQANPDFEGFVATINTSLANARQGPGTDSVVLGIVGIGEAYRVLGQNEEENWWRVCCYNEQEFWILKDLVNTTNISGSQASPAQTFSSQGNPEAAPPTSTPVPEEAASSTVDVPGTDGFSFDLIVAEQFPETSVVRIFLYVYSGQVQALTGYTLRVTKDGNELPTDSQSFGPQAGFTWPVATARQRLQNLKIEFPGQAPAGDWVAQLVDSAGNPVGPPTTFTLAANDPNQELYVRYQQK
ncbi:MAG: SH3 domain-containing protein [Chloroflexota bacterium]